MSMPEPQFFNVTSAAPYVVHVEINRPKKLNAFHSPMWVELKHIFKKLSTDSEVRAIVLSGAGDRAFTSGVDVEDFAKPGGPLLTEKDDPSRTATFLRRYVFELQDCISTVARCEKPVIALLHGYSFGLAIDLSSACDIRVCTSDTRFCVKEIDIGLAADVGTLSRLPKVVGMTSWLKEVCFSGRPFSAEEAKQNLFVSHVVCGGKTELVNEGIKLAQLIASKSPVAVQGTKNILDATCGRTVEEHLTYTAVWNSTMVQSSDVQRAIRSGLLRKIPTFEKL